MRRQWWDSAAFYGVLMRLSQVAAAVAFTYGVVETFK